MLFTTAKLPQKAFIIDLFHRLYGVQQILYNPDYLQITNYKNEKSLYCAILQFILAYIM